jgi:hypothetical protein
VFINPRKGALKGQTLYISRADFAAICERGATLRREHRAVHEPAGIPPVSEEGPLALEGPDVDPGDATTPEGFSVDPAVVRGVLLGAMGNQDRLSNERIREVLVAFDPEVWGRREDEGERAYATRVGALLSEVGITLRDALRLPDGSRSRGIYRSDLMP